MRYDAFHDASLKIDSKSFSVYSCLRSRNSFQETWFWLQFADVWAEIIGCLLDPYEITPLTCLWCLYEQLFQLLYDTPAMWVVYDAALGHCPRDAMRYQPLSMDRVKRTSCVASAVTRLHSYQLMPVGHLKTIICTQRCNTRDKLWNGIGWMAGTVRTAAVREIRMEKLFVVLWTRSMHRLV